MGIKIPKSRAEKRTRRHLRVRKAVKGTASRPRLVVYRSLKHITAQLVDDDAAHTLAAGWLREAGLDVSVDDAGNLHGRRGRARVWSGSHLDSVPTAGRFESASPWIR